MFAILDVLWIFVVDIFKSRRRLEAENLFLHHQLNIAVRRAPPRLRLYGSDRALLVWMTRIWPGLGQGFEDGGLTDGCNARSRFAPSMRVGGGIILLSGSSTVRDDNK